METGEALGDAEGPIIAASDYMKVMPDQLAPWLAPRLMTLGTDGFGRSDNREHLRSFFEVNVESIVAAALSKLDELKTLSGEEIDVDTNPDGKTVEMDDSKIVPPEIEASNGVVHVIDAVLQP